MLIHKHQPAQGAAEFYAFLAANHRGVFRLLLQGTSIVDGSLGNGWPILLGGTAAYKGVALSPAANQLVVAVGAELKVDRQVFGECSVPVACDFEPTRTPSPQQWGVRVFNLSGSTFADTVTQVNTASVSSINAQKVRTRGDPLSSGGVYEIDVAGDTTGLRLFRSQTTGGHTTVDAIGSWDRKNKVLVNATDDGVIATVSGGSGPVDVLYAITENGIGVINLSAGQGPLPEPVGVIDASEAVLVGGLTGTNPDFLLTGGDAGIALYSLLDPLAPAHVSFSISPPLGGEKHRNLQIIPSIPGVGTSAPWAYVLFHRNGIEPTPGFSILDLGPVVAGGSSTGVLAIYKESDPVSGTCEGASPARFFGDILVRPMPGGNHAVYIPYGPRAGGVVNGCAVPPGPEGGLFIYEVRPDTSGGVATVEIIKRAHVTAFFAAAPLPSGEPPSQAAGFVSYSAATNRIYCAYACYGTAAFDLSGDLSASLAGHRSAWLNVDGDTFGRSALHVIEHGGFVYTSYLGGNPDMITREPAIGFGSNVEFYSSPMNPISLLGDPNAMDHVYVFDGRGGIHRVRFP